MSSIIVCTTFPDNSWDIYSKQMLQSFCANWPADVPIWVGLDDDLLKLQVQQILNRDGDSIAIGWNKEHADFVTRNTGKDHPDNYRMMPVRFCHKVFTIFRALQAVMAEKADGKPIPRYLIWLDADVHTVRKVTHEELKECLPKDGDAFSYMGRKDWDHSECGWLAFDLESGGQKVIERVVALYLNDEVLSLEQQHDSWVWDKVRNEQFPKFSTNLTPSAAGIEAWPQSPMGKWSVHYKGPQAKANLAMHKPQAVQQMVRQQTNGGQRVVIQTMNAIPDAEIQAHIEKNQSLIKQWVRDCTPTDEEIVVVSAGPMLIAEDLRKEVEAGKRIMAVKNALVPLREAGIKPWCCILLDPRPHVADFVKDADPDIIWFVASQVDPAVTMELLARGCTVWGYHAAVNAGEEKLIEKQHYAIVNGGSATATRGLYLLNLLGFSHFNLYGYDQCYPDKVDLNALDNRGQPRFMEYSIGLRDALYPLKRCFWTEPQLIAQFEEINNMVMMGKFKLTAHGYGMVPFLLKGQQTADLRRKELNAKMNAKPPVPCDDLLKWNSSKKTPYLIKPRTSLPQTRRKRSRGSNS